jgi:putative flavoprotein involved in K+ transport
VLVAGAGNSGAEIAKELSAAGRETLVAGRPTGAPPFSMEGFLARLFLARFVLRVVFHRILTVRTKVGRKARPKMMHKGGPLIRTREPDLRAAGVRRVAKVVGVRDGLPFLEDGTTVDAASVVWCSGFHPGFDWVDLPIFDEHGEPRHHEGIAEGEPGLYFVGLHFLFAMSSTMIHGVGRDAERIAGNVVAKHRAAVVPALPLAAAVG